MSFDQNVVWQNRTKLCYWLYAVWISLESELPSWTQLQLMTGWCTSLSWLVAIQLNCPSSPMKLKKLEIFFLMPAGRVPNKTIIGFSHSDVSLSTEFLKYCPTSCNGDLVYLLFPVGGNEVVEYFGQSVKKIQPVLFIWLVSYFDFFPNDAAHPAQYFYTVAFSTLPPRFEMKTQRLLRT